MHVALFFATSRGNDDEGDFEVGTLVGKGSVRGQWFLKFKDDSTHTFSSRKTDYNKQWMFVQADGGGSPTVPPPPGAASAAPTTVPPPPEAPSAAQPTAAPVSSARVFWYASQMPMPPGYTAIRLYDSLLLRPGKRCGP